METLFEQFCNNDFNMLFDPSSGIVYMQEMKESMPNSNYFIPSRASGQLWFDSCPADFRGSMLVGPVGDVAQVVEVIQQGKNPQYTGGSAEFMAWKSKNEFIACIRRLVARGLRKLDVHLDLGLKEEDLSEEE